MSSIISVHYYTIIDNVLYNITCTWQNRVLIFCVDIYLTWKCSIVMLKGVGRHLKPSFRKTFEIWSRIPLNLDHKGLEKPIILIGDEKTNTFLWFHEAGFNPSPWQNGGQWKLTLWPQYYISCSSPPQKWSQIFITIKVVSFCDADSDPVPLTE